ncbi:hypothetical protein [Faecalispora jeddahensis]|uniref:hypothetical protein n=1 Tax=Faecalispora jeddahensis TaxID=1414721 RepID=UPI00145A0671|nr:hypothetical protein [Faecalispora jeddahensis]
MNNKFVQLKRVLVPVMIALVTLSQMVGCASTQKVDFEAMIDKGESIVLEVNEPDYKISVQGEQDQTVTWVQLDQLKTYPAFRQDFDTLLNINTITSGTGGKQGCLYVVNVDGQDMRSGNTTLADAFRNKVFIEKYWNNADKRSAIAGLSEKAYKDVKGSDEASKYASINAYFNLLNDSKNPESFNETQSVTREQFYTMMLKSGTRVTSLDYYPSADEFTKAVGGETAYTRYAKEVANLGFLQTDTKSLDSSNISTPISRAEAVYMVVQQYFPQEFAEATSKDKAYSDTKSAGDLALSSGFKVQGKDTDGIQYKERWQAYTLAEMFQSPNKGMQDELYRAMVVSKEKGLLAESESKWDEPLNKADTIELMINAQLALNKDHGYLTTTEYATIEAPADKVDTDVKESQTVYEATPESEKQVVPEDKQTPVDVVYNEEYDTNKDGSIDIDEWNEWVKKNPADANKDMVITETEKKAYEESKKPTTSSKPSTSSGSTSSGSKTTSGGKASSGTTTQKPTTPTQPSTDDDYDEAAMEKWLEEQGQGGPAGDPNNGGGFVDDDSVKVDY